MNTPARSCFLVIEAVDLAGKSTQLAALAQSLRALGLSVATTAYPDREAPITGALIDQVLHGQLPLVPAPELEAADPTTRSAAAQRQMLLVQALYALNRRERADQLEELMAHHQVVLSSRYQLSGLVYAQGSGVPKADIEVLLGGLEADLRKPDLTLVLDVDPDVVVNRPRAQALDTFERDRNLQLENRRIYRQIADQDPAVVLVDGSGNPEQVAANLLAAVRQRRPELFR